MPTLAGPSMKQAALTDEDLGQHLLTASGTFKSVKSTAIALSMLFVVLIVIEGLKMGEWDVLVERAPGIFLIWLIAVALIRGFVQLMRVHVFTGGLRGRSWWGFRRRARWNEIKGFRYDSSSGLPAIILEIEHGKELWLLREIAEREEFQRTVAPYFDWRGFFESRFG